MSYLPSASKSIDEKPRKARLQTEFMQAILIAPRKSHSHSIINEPTKPLISRALLDGAICNTIENTIIRVGRNLL